MPQSSISLGCDDSLFFSRKMFEPSTNLVYKKMHMFAKEAQTRVRQSNDDLLAWKFNPERLVLHFDHCLSSGFASDCPSAGVKCENSVMNVLRYALNMQAYAGVLLYLGFGVSGCSL